MNRLPFGFRLVLEDHNFTPHCHERTKTLLKILNYSFYQFAQSQRRSLVTILALIFFMFKQRLPSTKATSVCVRAVFKKRPSFLNSAPTSIEGALWLLSAPSDRF
jgi:hypothetical protein